jgi:nucleotide-binding universal stress UspA family protein
MFSKLLVAIDAGTESHASLPLARELAEAVGAQIVLLQVVPRVTPREAHRVRLNLDRLAAELARAGIRVQAVLRRGNAADEIVQQAHESGATLIVVTTSCGGGGLRGFVLGSTAHQILKASPVPVLELRPGRDRARKPRRLLVPVDGSPGGAGALDVALELARATGATVDVLEVVAPIPPSSLDVGLDREWQQDALASARQYVHRLVARLHAAGVHAEGHARLGPVVPSIVAAATEADVDLIIVSTHAVTGPARAVLGGVADALARQALQPVLLVRREPRPRPLVTRHVASDVSDARSTRSHVHV